MRTKLAARAILLPAILLVSCFAAQQTDIHKVDFNNFNYPVFCAVEPDENVTASSRCSATSPRDGLPHDARRNSLTAS
jgi:hypothetical protein